MKRKKAKMTLKVKVKAKTQVTKKQNTFSTKKQIVAVSGGFDPVHIGHVRMFNQAKKLGDILIVILNNDNWLRAKKGYVFMPEHERKEVIEAFGAVDEVIVSSHPEDPSDMSVCEELISIRPHIFVNGGDRTNKNVPEIPVCKEINCKMVYNVGQGGKVQSSSWLVGNANSAKSNTLQTSMPRSLGEHSKKSKKPSSLD